MKISNAVRAEKKKDQKALIERIKCQVALLHPGWQPEWAKKLKQNGTWSEFKSWGRRWI